MYCRICEGPCIDLARLGHQPLANKYPNNKLAAERQGFWDLTCLICSKCFAGQLSEIISRDEMFLDYYYLSSVNPELVEHFDALAMKLSDRKFVLDIGSNDGILLRPLKKLGVHCLGIDPSINVGEIANNAGLETIIGFFNSDAVEAIENNYGKPDTIIASSIFTHLEDPQTFVRDLGMLLSEEGEIVIEIEYLLSMIKNYQFERFYFDRTFYYSVTSLSKLFSSNGFLVHDIEEITPHGGSLRIYISREGANYNVTKKVLDMLAVEKEVFAQDEIQQFQDKIDNYATELREALEKYSKQGLKVCGFGAPARLATITNFAKIGPDLIEYIVDDSPLKCGKVSPGMSIPIKNRTHMENNPPDVVIVFAYEYFQSIFKFTSKFNVNHYQPIPFNPLFEV